MKPKRVLYLSPVDMCTWNGMAQMQHQILSALCYVYGDSVDLLSLAATVATARKWLGEKGLPVRVLQGIYPSLAYLNTTLWYGGGVVLCNKLRWIDRFYFPLRTPLPRSWIDRYSVIDSFYPWAFHLLRLERAGNKVVADLADIMADRHERIGARRWITLTAADEKAIFHSRARCVAASQADAEEFEQLYGIRPAVASFVPPESEQLIELAGQERPPRVGFLGAPSYVNEEIMRLLARPEFLECLAQAGVELVVAGGICRTVEPSVLHQLEQGGARILGHIPTTVDYYRQISATLNPVGPSTGVKIKSIETLIAGRTLITTRWGVDASLCSAFSDQILLTDWPVDPAALGALAVEAARLAVPHGASSAKAYIEGCKRAMLELHTL